jgi:hypothetical protein
MSFNNNFSFSEVIQRRIICEDDYEWCMGKDLELVVAQMKA